MTFDPKGYSTEQLVMISHTAEAKIKVHNSAIEWHTGERATEVILRNKAEVEINKRRRKVRK